MRALAKSVTSLFAACCLGFLVAGCSSDSNTSTTSSTQTPIGAKTLDSAASFLGGATGKEYPINVDAIVFVNSVLGINKVDNDAKNLYGDLWVLLRDPYGVPILDQAGCIQPIASEPFEIDGVVHTTVPMILEEYMDGQFKCTLVEGYEQYAIPLDIGRLNMVRSSIENPEMFARAFEEAINNINNADSVKTDAAGRLVMVYKTEVVDPGTGAVSYELTEKTVDAPRDNLALYKALMVQGRLAGYGVSKIGDEGQTVPAPWLEIRKSLDMGDLAYLRDGTPGRDHGVDLINGYADVSRTTHSTQGDFSGKQITYVQYMGDTAACKYVDAMDDAWTRIFGSEVYTGTNMAAFARQADDSRRVIEFTHNVIQDLPETGIAALPSEVLVNSPIHKGFLDVNEEGNVVNPNRHRLLETAASMIGAASNKTVPLTVDGLAFVNTVLGLNQIDYGNIGDVYGDLYVLLRNANGEPILDANNCVQPIAASPVVWPDGITRETVPMMLDENGKCTIVVGYETYVVEIELGRLNCVRTALTNPRVLDHHLYEAVKAINSAQELKLDLSGRLTYTVTDETGALVDKAIDSPRENAALYAALMRWGKLEGSVELMQEGQWVTVPIQITLDDTILNQHGLRFLKYGDELCEGSGHCGASRLPSGYVDYSQFEHSSQADFSTVNVSYVERQADTCGYADRTSDLWQKVLKSNTAVKSNIAAFVMQAEDTRKIIQFIHTKIQDPDASSGDL